MHPAPWLWQSFRERPLSFVRGGRAGGLGHGELAEDPRGASVGVLGFWERGDWLAREREGAFRVWGAFAMIVSGESKTGQTHSRARSRRRVGESDASRLPAAVVSSHHPQQEHLSVAVGGMIRGMTSAPIVVEDEDDDVLVASPTAFAQAKSIANGESRRSTRSRVVVEEDPLELRLGLGGTSHYSIRSASQTSATHQQPLLVRRGRQIRPTIDLTTPSRQAPANEDCVLLTDTPKSRKRKHVSMETSVMKEFPPASPVREKEEDNRLKCAICMDTMQEETSTICGHLFCQSCIQGAIKSQKKCPTCRKKLTMKNIHRIYI